MEAWDSASIRTPGQSSSGQLNNQRLGNGTHPCQTGQAVKVGGYGVRSLQLLHLAAARFNLKVHGWIITNSAARRFPCTATHERPSAKTLSRGETRDATDAANR